MKNKITFILFFIFLTIGVKAQIITTVAGDSTAGYNGDGIPAIESELYRPIGIAVDSAGNFYIGDTHNNRIRKVNTLGVITTIAGTGVAGFTGDGGPATDAELHWPFGVAVDGIGNIYIADDANSRIRKISSAGIITTIAGTDTFGYNGDGIPATAAELNAPSGVAVDKNGNIYVADFDNNRIRKINDSGIITTFAGNGTAGFGNDNVPATAAEIYHPYGIAVDNMYNLYIACYHDTYVYKVDALSIFSVIAGTGTTGYSGDGGPATLALLNSIAVAVDISGNIYLADDVHSVVRMVNTSGIISTTAGTGVGFYNGDNQPATDADLYTPSGVAVNAKGGVYVADFANNRIRYIQNALGVKNLNQIEDNLIIYPNPSNGMFMINIPSDITGIEKIIITNEYGEIIKELNAYTNQQIEIKMDNATPGLYFLTVIGKQEQYSIKVIIKA